MSVKSDSPGSAGFVGLAEDDLLILAVDRPPGADAPLQGAANAGAEIGMAPDDLLEDRDRTQPGRCHEHGHDLRLEHLAQGIGPPAATGRLLDRGKPGVTRQAIPGRGADRRFGGRHGHPVGVSELHEEPHLVIGHVAAGHEGAPQRGGHPSRPAGRDHHGRQSA